MSRERTTATTERSGELAYTGGERHPFVEAFLAEVGGARPGLDIHAHDHTYRYLLGERAQHRGLALVQYFRCGLVVADLAEQILEAAYGKGAAKCRVVDFASGFGRGTRFWVTRRDPATLHVSDIDPAALDFQADRFGVPTHESALRPRELQLGVEADALFAFSFFSHVPPKGFEEWLEALWRHVAEDGILVFSTAGPTALPPGRALGTDGFHFERETEIPTLETDDYGATWVSSERVRLALATVCGRDTPVVHHGRALWHSQDLWVVGRRATWKSQAISVEPEGYLERVEVRPSGWRLSGWAVDPQRAADPLELQIALDGQRAATVSCDGQRPDVAAAYPEARSPGFVADLTPPPGTHGRSVLTVRVSGARDGTSPLFVGTLEDGAVALEALAWRRREAEVGAKLSQVLSTVEANRVRGVRDAAARFLRVLRRR